MPAVPPSGHHSPSAVSSHSAAPLPSVHGGNGGIGNTPSSAESASKGQHPNCFVRFGVWILSLISRLFCCCVRKESFPKDPKENVASEVEDSSEVKDPTEVIVEESENEESENVLDEGEAIKTLYEQMKDADLPVLALDRNHALEWTSGADTYWVWFEASTNVIHIEKKEGNGDRNEFAQMQPQVGGDVKLYREEQPYNFSEEELAVMNQLLEHVERAKEQRDQLRELANRFNPACLSLLFGFFSGPKAVHFRYNASANEQQKGMLEVDNILGEEGEAEVFCIWVKIENGNYRFNFQESLQYHRASQEKKLGITLSPQGEILSVWMNGSEISPEDFQTELYDRDSEWNKRLTKIIHQFLLQQAFNPNYELPWHDFVIAVHQLAIQQVPEAILERLDEGGNLQIRNISFLKDSLERQDGIDAGGLRKEFVSLLALSLLDGNSARHIKMSSKMPDLKNVAEIPMLNRLGRLISLCQRDNDLIIGRLFSDHYFKLLRHIAGVYNGQPLSEEQLMEAINILTQEPQALNLSNEAATELAWIHSCVFNDSPLTEEQKQYVKDVLMLDVSEGNYHQALRQYLLDAYETRVKAAWHILQGMSNNDRNLFKYGYYATLSIQVQGMAFNRQNIVSRIEMNAQAQQSPVIRQKVEWLKAHILDENTPQEWVERFLFTVTGQKALSSASKINISVANDSKCFAHTCFNRLDVPTTHTDVGSDEGSHPDNRAKFFNNLALNMSVSGYDAG